MRSIGSPLRLLTAAAAALALLVAGLLAAGCGSGTGRDRTGATDAQGRIGESFELVVSRPVGGTVTTADGLIRCGTAGGGADACGPVAYPWSSTVSLSAVPDLGYRFVAWAADCSGTGDCAVHTGASGADKTVAAAFVPLARYAGSWFLVAVARPAGGVVESTDGRLRCGTAGSSADACGPALYRWTDVVTLAATPDAGFALAGWTGDCAGTGACTLDTTTASADKELSAEFAVTAP